jgi:hypothetical protein
MSDDQIDLWCGHCNQTFSTFLHELAEKNAKVICPKCGEGHDGKPPADSVHLTGQGKQDQEKLSGRKGDSHS